MNTYKQTSERIDYATLLHKKINDFYKNIHAITEKERLKIRLDYLGKHEKHHKETLTKRKNEASNKAMNTWGQSIHINISSYFLENIETKLNLSVVEVVSSALELNNSMIELYQGIIVKTKVEEVDACLLAY